MRTDFRLGEFVIRPRRHLIEVGEESVRLKPKSMAVLIRLADAGGQVVSRDELFEAVWPGGIVSDDALTQCIVDLRKAMGDTARDARVIETIPKQGFRLIPPVSPLEQTVQSDAPGRRELSMKTRLLVGLFLVVLLLALYAWLRLAERRFVAEIADEASLAVMPFVDMSPGKDQDYLSDGLTEELLNRLSQLDGLRVTGRTSSFYFKGKHEEPRVIGELLGVDHLLEGSVRKAGDQLRITAQLVNTSSGYQLWSARYDRRAEDIFAIQDEIAAAVATALSVKLGVGELARVEGGTTNLQAYEAYLLGKSLFADFTPERVKRAIEYFETAVALDPSFALAWEGLADIYRHGRLLMGPEDWTAWERKEDAALARALALAPESIPVLEVVAYSHGFRGQWQDAHRTYDRLLARSGAADAKVSGSYGDFLLRVGRGKDAIRLLEGARRLDPLSGVVAFNLGHAYEVSGRLEEAAAELERGMSLTHTALVSQQGLSTALAIGDRDLIETWVARSIEHQPLTRELNQTMAQLLDDPAAAVAVLHRALQERPAPYVRAEIVMWAAYHGADELVESNMGPWNFWHPLLSDVRRRAGFKARVREAGLVEYWREFGWSDHCRPLGLDDFQCD